MTNLKSEHEFAGNASELSAVASALCRQNSWSVDPDKLNERLVRYYVTAGVIDRPDRQGREAMYGFRHLVQLLVARRMSEQGVTLQVIAQHNLETTTAQLELSLFQALPTEAELLVRSFKKGRAVESELSSQIITINNQKTNLDLGMRRSSRQIESTAPSAKPQMAITDVLAEVRRMKDEWLNEVAFMKRLQQSVDTLRAQAGGQSSMVSEISEAQRRLVQTLESMAQVSFEREQAFMAHIGEMIQRQTYEIQTQLTDLTKRQSELDRQAIFFREQFENFAKNQQMLIDLLAKTDKRVDDS